MNDKPFLDTNVLIYAVAEGDPRADIARTLVAREAQSRCTFSMSSSRLARRKYKMSWAEVREALADFRILCPEPVPITIETHKSALGISERYGYRIYDSLVIAAALQAGSNTLYSEDMHASHKIKDLTIRNPFRSS